MPMGSTLAALLCLFALPAHALRGSDEGEVGQLDVNYDELGADQGGQDGSSQGVVTDNVMQLVESLERSNKTRDVPYVPWPASYLNAKFLNPRYLGSGTFGESFLATGASGTDYAGKAVVVKLLYIEESDNHVHVTKRLADRNPKLRKDLEDAVEECDFARTLQANAGNMGSRSRYAERLMNCFGHNYLETNRDAPIYMVLENCGYKELGDWARDHARDLTSDLLASIMKQIAEALDYLAHMTPFPVIHHDLKPANIVVKELDNGKVVIHLIDFGGMMFADPDTDPGGTVCTVTYAPNEWTAYGDAWLDPPTSFDMVAFGNIFAKLATGMPFQGMWFDDRTDVDSPKYRLVNTKVVENNLAPTEFAQLLSRRVGCNRQSTKCTGLRNVAASGNTAGRQFLTTTIPKTVSLDPADRPTPADLLATPWLRAARPPRDPEWRLQPPSSLPRSVDKVYFVGDLVDVHSTSQNAWFTDGRVTTVDDDGGVEVQYNCDIDGCDSKDVDVEDFHDVFRRARATFTKGDKVWVWSKKHEKWFDDGEIIKVTSTTVKARYAAGARTQKRKLAVANKYFKRRHGQKKKATECEECANPTESARSKLRTVTCAGDWTGWCAAFHSTCITDTADGRTSGECHCDPGYYASEAGDACVPAAASTKTRTLSQERCNGGTFGFCSAWHCSCIKTATADYRLGDCVCDEGYVANSLGDQCVPELGAARAL